MLEKLKLWQWVLLIGIVLEAIFLWKTYLTYPRQFLSSFQQIIWWCSEPSVVFPSWMLAFGITLFKNNLLCYSKDKCRDFAKSMELPIILLTLIPGFSALFYPLDYETTIFFTHSFEGWVSLLCILLGFGFFLCATIFHSFDIHGALFEEHYDVSERIGFLGLFLTGGLLIPTALFRFINIDMATACGALFFIFMFIFIESVNNNAVRAIEERERIRKLSKSIDVYHSFPGEHKKAA